MEKDPKLTSNQIKAIGLAILILVLLVSAGCSFLLLTVENLAANVRDVLVIILALESILVGIGLMMLMWNLYQLVRLIREDIKPLIESTNETLTQVKHTTTFVGQSVAAPIISLSGMISGARAMADTLRGKKEPHELVRRERHDG